MSQENQCRMMRTVTSINYRWDISPDLDLRLMECHLPATKKRMSSMIPQESSIISDTLAVCSMDPSGSQSTIRRSSHLAASMPLSDSQSDDPFGTFYQVTDDQSPGCIIFFGA